MKYQYRYEPRKKTQLNYQKKFIEPVQFPIKRVLVMGIVLLVLIMCQIYNRVLIFDQSMDFSKLNKEVVLLEKNNNDLKIRLQALASHQRVARIAKSELGMVYPDMSQIIIYTPENKVNNELFAKL